MTNGWMYRWMFHYLDVVEACFACLSPHCELSAGWVYPFLNSSLHPADSSKECSWTLFFFSPYLGRTQRGVNIFQFTCQNLTSWNVFHIVLSNCGGNGGQNCLPPERERITEIIFSQKVPFPPQEVWLPLLKNNEQYVVLKGIKLSASRVSYF